MNPMYLSGSIMEERDEKNVINNIYKLPDVVWVLGVKILHEGGHRRFELGTCRGWALE